MDPVRSTAPSSYTYATALGDSLSRSKTPDPQVIARAPSPCLEKRQFTASNSFNVISGSTDESAGVESALSALKLSKNSGNGDDSQLRPQIEQAVQSHQAYLYGLHGESAYVKKTEAGNLHASTYTVKVLYTDGGRSNGRRPDAKRPTFMVNRQVEHPDSPLASQSAYM